MKLVNLLFVATTITSTTVSTTAQPVANANATAMPTIRMPSNASKDSLQWTACRMQSGAFGQWWYNSRNDGPYYCYGRDYNSWGMLNSYRSGGTLNVHWKYTENVNDPECLVDWEYYGEDGRTLYAKIRGRTTLERESRRWCALPVYRSGGAEAYQWSHCSCWEEGLPGQ